ncbi:hypothetical protein M5E87_02200 [Flavonifractor plautii]|nr:hypothetical protein M5E87_02200 [Flavonifractor plautii]
MIYDIRESELKGAPMLYSEQYEAIRTSPLFHGFRYIKTFTPMRRITTSYAASVRFMLDREAQGEEVKVVPDVLAERLVNRSFMVDQWDRLYRDSVLVRFEDGKLNPRATFTALAEFLDLPYTESMTYCSSRKGIDPESLKGNARGFDPATVYRTYDEFANDEERAFWNTFCGTLTNITAMIFTTIRESLWMKPGSSRRSGALPVWTDILKNPIRMLCRARKSPSKMERLPLMSLLSPLFPATRATAAALRISCSVACGL